MKKLILLLSVFIFSLSGFSAIVSQSTAELVAKNIYFERANMKENVPYDKIEMNLAYVASENQVAVMYIFNEMYGNGFVIVAAEDRVVPVLGYSFEGSFDIKNNKNLAFNEWMNLYSDQIQNVRDRNLLASSEATDLWAKYILKPELSKAGQVGPLLTTQWDQGQYYNALCPGGSVTGCVATMMAQIMRYFKHPAQGEGSHSYNSNYGTLTADFGSTTYNWENMPNTLMSANNDVATLMYHCGVSVNMNYSPGGSGASMDNALSSLKVFFKYSPHAFKIDKAQYTDFDWKNAIRAQLLEGRPIMYSGPGHAFICDGFQYPDHFHFNWGWGGLYDGYFYLTSLTPGSGQNYTNGQDAMVDLKPLPTAIEEEGISNNTIYPNPATDELNIQLNNSNQEMNTVRIMDMSGRIIVEEQLFSNHEVISLSSLTRGSYLVQILHDQRVLMNKKVIKL